MSPSTMSVVWQALVVHARRAEAAQMNKIRQKLTLQWLPRKYQAVDAYVSASTKDMNQLSASEATGNQQSCQYDIQPK
jgi:hypothetical protein